MTGLEGKKHIRSSADTLEGRGRHPTDLRLPKDNIPRYNTRIKYKNAKLT